MVRDTPPTSYEVGTSTGADGQKPTEHRPPALAQLTRGLSQSKPREGTNPHQQIPGFFAVGDSVQPLARSPSLAFPQPHSLPISIVRRGAFFFLWPRPLHSVPAPSSALSS